MTLDARILSLADRAVRRRDVARMGFGWGEGLLAWSLVRLDRARYEGFARAWLDAHAEAEVRWSDECAPGLAAVEIGHPVAARVRAYVERAPLTRDGGVEHFGLMPRARVYPSSMWVDSMMMLVTFAARAGMRDLAATQALAFARVLFDPRARLWHHARWSRLGVTLPGRGAFWLRGNGWAMASLPQVIEALGEDDARRVRLSALLRETADALAARVDENGLWRTLVGDHAAYVESSGSALVACGLMHGARLGVLGAGHRALGERAYEALLARLTETPDGPSMPDVSGPTMPYPPAIYRLIPRMRDLDWGLAALFLAAHERANGR